MKQIGRLHLLTDTKTQSRFTHLELAALGIAGGADTIQFREKTGSTRAMIEITTRIKELCAKANIPLIVNDRIDVTLAADADGVHLGQDDFPIQQARQLLGPHRIIGGSASSLEEAYACLRAGADYIGYGPVFQTTSKDDAGPVQGIKLLQEVVAKISLPIIAIGGIGIENISEVRQTGAYGIAVISAICCQPDPKAATSRMRLAWDGRE